MKLENRCREGIVRTGGISNANKKNVFNKNKTNFYLINFIRFL